MADEEWFRWFFHVIDLYQFDFKIQHGKFHAKGAKAFIVA